jgi:hypothetical protein
LRPSLVSIPSSSRAPRLYRFSMAVICMHG